MDTYWVPGVNNRGDWGRWAFVELTDVWEIEGDFAAKVEQAFETALGSVVVGGV